MQVATPLQASQMAMLIPNSTATLDGTTMAGLPVAVEDTIIMDTAEGAIVSAALQL